RWVTLPGDAGTTGPGDRPDDPDRKRAGAPGDSPGGSVVMNRQGVIATRAPWDGIQAVARRPATMRNGRSAWEEGGYFRQTRRGPTGPGRRPRTNRGADRAATGPAGSRSRAWAGAGCGPGAGPGTPRARATWSGRGGP